MYRRQPVENPTRVVCTSNAFIFNQFRTLLRNGARATRSVSITSALFPMQRCHPERSEDRGNKSNSREGQVGPGSPERKVLWLVMVPLG